MVPINLEPSIVPPTPMGSPSTSVTLRQLFKNLANYLIESGQASIVGNEYMIEPKKHFVRNSSKHENQIRLPDSVYKPNIQNSQFVSKL